MAEKAKPKRTLLWSIAVVIMTFPLFLLFNYLGKPANGRAAWFFALTLVLVIKVRWDLRKRVWFWITIAAVIALHVPLILFVPWTAKWVPAFVTLPFCVVDAIAILTIIQFVEKQMGPPQNVEELNASTDLKSGKLFY